MNQMNCTLSQLKFLKEWFTFDAYWILKMIFLKIVVQRSLLDVSILFFFHFWSISKRRHDSRIVYSAVVSIHFTIITANHKYADNNERAAMRSILFCFLCAFRLLKNFSPWSGSYCCFHFEKAQFQYEKEWRWWTNFLNRADDNTHSQKELFEVFGMYKKQKNNWGKLCRQFILYL